MVVFALVFTMSTVTAASAVTLPLAGAEGTNECRADNPFDRETRRELRARLGHHVTAAVVDHRSGCTFTLNASKVVVTASIFKVAMMASTAANAIDEQRPLSYWERAQVAEMISWSSNSGASALLHATGGPDDINAFYASLGMDNTFTPVTSWGKTTTTAMDQVTLLQAILNQREPFSKKWRSYFWRTLGTVVPEQRWGVTAGVDETRYDVRLKNGWAPQSPCCDDWAFNSIGQVRDRRDGEVVYTIAILSSEWDGWVEGIGAVEEVSTVVATRLGVGAT
jgi:hypothetical protein